MHETQPDSPAGPDASERHLVEGLARIVAIEGNMAWLEPDMSTSSCGGCGSAAVCSAKVGGQWLKSARRFPIPNDFNGRVGELVVVGVYDGALVRASSVAYAIPLCGMIGGGALGQWLLGSDGGAILSAVAGLLLGWAVAALRAGRLSSRGELAPYFLRRAHGIPPGGDCSHV